VGKIKIENSHAKIKHKGKVFLKTLIGLPGYDSNDDSQYHNKDDTKNKFLFSGLNLDKGLDKT